MLSILKIKNFINGRLNPKGLLPTLSSILTFIKKCDNNIKDIYCGFCGLSSKNLIAKHKLNFINVTNHNCALTN